MSLGSTSGEIAALAGLVRERTGQPSPAGLVADPVLRDRLTSLLSRALLDQATSGTPDAALLRTLADLHWTCAAGDADIAAHPGLALYSAIPAAAVPAPVRAALRRADSPLRIPLRTGLAAMREHQRTGDPEALRHGLFWMLHTALAPTGPKHHSYALSNLHQCFSGLFRATDDIGLLDQAVAFGRIATETLPDSDSVTVSTLRSLSEALRDRFEHRGVLADLDEAVTMAERSVTGTVADATLLGACLTTLSIALHDRSVESGDQGDLTRALATTRQAMDVMPLRAPERGTVLVNALAVFGRAAHTGASADGFRTVLRIGDRTLGELGPSSPHRPIVLGSLSDIRILRFLHERRPADLHAAVRLARAAVDGIDVADPHAGRLRATLARALHRRYEVTGRLEDLDEAVAVPRRPGAVAQAPQWHPERPMFLSNLGNLLRTRYDVMGQAADLAEAITAGRDAVAGAGTALSDRGQYLHNLGIALVQAHGRDGGDDVLAEAVTCLHEAVRAAPGQVVERALYRGSLAGAHLTRFKRGRDPADLTAALDQLRHAVDETATAPHHQALHLCNLSAAVHMARDRPEVTVPEDELSLAERAVAVSPPGTPHHARSLTTLGRALWHRSDADQAHAVDCWRMVVRTATATVAERFEAARLWVIATSDGDAEAALPAFAATIDLLPEFVWHGLDRKTRERHLTTVQGLGAGAAAFALRAGRTEDAVTWLEQSRNVLWGQLFQLRDDRAGLRRARPELASRLDAIRALLD